MEALIETNDSVCLSFFMTTYRAGNGINKNLRLKNLMRVTEQKLYEGAIPSSERDRLPLPVRKHIEDDVFWRHQRDGLAIYSSDNLYRLYRLPIELQQLSMASKRFHVKPLLPLLMYDGQFYILALSLNNVRLLQGTHYTVSEIEFPIWQALNPIQCFIQLDW